ncbi:MAG: phosphate signaling complex protein PhoU [Acidobacteriota bacterium]
MHRHLDEELEALKKALLEMGGLVERQIDNAMTALVDADVDLARSVIARDKEVDEFERRIDESCVRILALFQPAARDLRFVTLGLKIVTDLERQGDQAVNIAERAIELAEEPPLKPYIDLPRMSLCARRMLDQALEAFVRGDAAAAHKILGDDDQVDQLTSQLFREILTYMIENPKNILRGTRILFVAKYLERIADHATNIAEMVIFNIEGKDVRHGHDDTVPAVGPGDSAD